MGAGLSLDAVEDVICCRSEHDEHDARVKITATKRGRAYGGDMRDHLHVHTVAGGHTSASPAGSRHANAPPSQTRVTRAAGAPFQPPAASPRAAVRNSTNKSYHYAGGVLSGNLFKRGRWNSGYQQRFFMIKADEKRIYYYQDFEEFKHGKPSKGHIDLQGCTAETVNDFERQQHEEEWRKLCLHHRAYDPAEAAHKTLVRQDPQAFYFEFVVRNKQRTFELATEHGKEREEWMATIFRFVLNLSLRPAPEHLFVELISVIARDDADVQFSAALADTMCIVQETQCTANKLSYA